MNYESSIVVNTTLATELHESLMSETEKSTDKRASWTMEKEDNKLIFKITAKDSVALRAVLNSITKLITVFEKAREIQ